MIIVFFEGGQSRNADKAELNQQSLVIDFDGNDEDEVFEYTWNAVAQKWVEVNGEAAVIRVIAG